MIVDDFPDVRQFWTNDCGVACLTAVLRFLGTPNVGGFRQSRDELLSAYDLVAFAKSVALDAIGIDMEARSLDKADLPVILHWDGNHFVVLYELTGDGALILDPSRGKAHCTWDVIEERHTGVTILFGAAADRARAMQT